MVEKPFILDIPFDEFTSTIEKLGLKKYASKQILSWIFIEDLFEPEKMTNISKDGRSIIQKEFSWKLPEIAGKEESLDGTIKIAIRLNDGNIIESVLIPNDEKSRHTVCLSSQVGCSLGCKFCRTSRMGFIRNLTIGEILSQVILLKRLSKEPISNIVFMGMGEPLLNADNVKNAIMYLIDDNCFNFSKNRITISTSGISNYINDFSDKFKVKLAISLNSAVPEKRSKLMPVENKYPIKELIKECGKYCKNSRHRVTFEYIMIKDINDTDEDMKAVLKLLNGVPAKINLIPFNPFPDCPFKPSSQEIINKWWHVFHEKGIQTNLRKSRGQDIKAACGLLAVNTK